MSDTITITIDSPTERHHHAIQLGNKLLGGGLDHLLDVAISETAIERAYQVDRTIRVQSPETLHMAYLLLPAIAGGMPTIVCHCKTAGYRGLCGHELGLLLFHSLEFGPRDPDITCGAMTLGTVHRALRAAVAPCRAARQQDRAPSATDLARARALAAAFLTVEWGDRPIDVSPHRAASLMNEFDDLIQRAMREGMDTGAFYAGCRRRSYGGADPIDTEGSTFPGAISVE